MNNYIYLLLVGLMIALPSCEDHFGDVNEDPNNPLEVTPNVILPQVQVRLAYLYHGDASRYLGINTQHVDGVGRQFVVFHNYGLQPEDVSQLWANIYSGVLNDNRRMGNIAAESGDNHWEAASKATEAYMLLNLTDWFGDVPYSEALQGAEILQPKFDDQQSIYEDIYSLLDEARDLFMQDRTGIPFSTGDLIYNGDPAKWLEFINSTEARARLHQANATGDYSAVLTALDKGSISSTANDARVTFGSTASNTAPWYQYIEQRDDCETGSTYRQLLIDMNDPRINTYGALQDVPGHPVFTRDRSVPMMTYTESKFIEAEAAMRTDDSGRAYNAFIEAVETNLNEQMIYYSNLDPSGNFIIGTDTMTVSEVDFAQVNSDYMNTLPDESSLTMEDILTQKYIAMYANPEVFADWRRTGIPELTPNTGDEIPRRLPYAQSEIISNENTPSPADVNQFSRVWWDQ